MKHERAITLLDEDVLHKSTTLRFRRAFQAILGVLAIAPMVASLTTLAIGTGRHGDGADIPVEVDSQLRYLGGVYFVVAVVVAYAALNIDRARTIVTIIGAAVFVGGLGRIASWVDVGRPDGITTFFIGIELVVVPLVLFAYRASFVSKPATGTAAS